MSSPPLQRIAIGIEYDGSGFHGWQSQQPGVRTVQSELEAALTHVADQPISLVCAGRTDAAVHASGQVAHFDTSASRTDRSWVLGANSRLPPEIRIHWATGVDRQFHARFGAIERRYRYIILNRQVASALLRNQVTWIRRPLDDQAMAAAACRMIGEHDFNSFRSTACQAHSSVRRVIQADIWRSGDSIYFDVAANGFLHHMVRNMVGVLLEVGWGERPAKWVDELLMVRDRTCAGVTAPPNGLYLVSVIYDHDHYTLPAPPPVPTFSA
jgi:tRNA pseudouridine38-40 synthase